MKRTHLFGIAFGILFLFIIQSAGTLVGHFSTTDLDPAGTHTYSLVSGAGALGASAL